MDGIIDRFRAAEIRRILEQSDNYIAVTPDPGAYLSLTVIHGIPRSKLGILYSAEPDRILIMSRTDYNRLKRREERMLSHGP